MDFAAGDRLAVPEGRPRWHPWAWGAAFLLHALAICIALFVHSRPPVQEAQSPPGVSVVFDNGGNAENTAPPIVRQGPPQQAAAPPTPPPPPPTPQAQPQTEAEAQAEVNLNMPQNPLATLPSAPKPQPTPPRPHPRPAPPQRYIVMNGMSYGNPSASAPPAPTHGRAMNLSLPQNDTQAVTGADFAVRGDAGADWDAALTKWVSEHAYYPQAAIAQNQQGTAEVEFTVDRNGHVTGLRLLRSANSTFLDQAWELLFSDNQLPPFPADAKDDHVTVDYTVHYQLVP